MWRLLCTYVANDTGDGEAGDGGADGGKSAAVSLDVNVNMVALMTAAVVAHRLARHAQ